MLAEAAMQIVNHDGEIKNCTVNKYILKTDQKKKNQQKETPCVSRPQKTLLVNLQLTGKSYLTVTL